MVSNGEMGRDKLGFGINTYNTIYNIINKDLCIAQEANINILLLQYYIISYMGKESEKIDMYVYMIESPKTKTTL